MTDSSTRARILVLIKGLGIGGAETLIADAAPIWDHGTFEYKVAYMLPWKDQLRSQIEAAGVEVIDLDWRGATSTGGPRNLRQLYRGFDPDLVHSHLPAAGVAARLLLPRPAHVYTEHNLVGHYRHPTRLLNRLTYARNSAVIAVSQAVAHSVSGYPGPRPLVIPNGVRADVARENPADVRRELGLANGTRLVVHVGNIRPYKGHSNLIAATRDLSANHADVLVVSIGGEKRHGDLERLKVEASSAGLDGKIRFLGRRPDARAYIAAADCVVNPSDVEGFPVVLLEALAIGRPVVATSVGGVSDVVRHEETGLLVPPGDPAALAQAIGRCLESPDASSWARNGRELVLAEYGLEKMVAGYETVYRDVLGI